MGIIEGAMMAFGWGNVMMRVFVGVLGKEHIMHLQGITHLTTASLRRV